MTVYLVCSVSVTLLRVEYAVPHTIVQGTGHSSTGIPVTFWLSTQGTEDDNQDVILTNGTPGARAEQAAGLASDSGSKHPSLFSRGSCHGSGTSAARPHCGPAAPPVVSLHERVLRVLQRFARGGAWVGFADRFCSAAIECLSMVAVQDVERARRMPFMCRVRTTAWAGPRRVTVRGAKCCRSIPRAQDGWCAGAHQSQHATYEPEEEVPVLPREQRHVRQAILWACFASGGINVICTIYIY